MQICNHGAPIIESEIRFGLQNVTFSNSGAAKLNAVSRWLFLNQRKIGCRYTFRSTICFPSQWTASLIQFMADQLNSLYFLLIRAPKIPPKIKQAKKFHWKHKGVRIINKCMKILIKNKLKLWAELLTERGVGGCVLTGENMHKVVLFI